MNSSHDKPIVLAITGASGAVYAVRLLQELACRGIEVHLVISPSGEAVVAQELKLHDCNSDSGVDALLQYTWPGESAVWQSLSDSQLSRYRQNIVRHDYRNFMTPIASGSFQTRGMVICPCSGSTLSGIVHASSSNLIHRAAEVHFKERRPLILVPRETPMSTFQLENLHRASIAGAVVLPAMPGWYHGVHSIVDLIDFVVARILDHLGIEHQLTQRWGETSLAEMSDYTQTGKD